MRIFNLPMICLYGYFGLASWVNAQEPVYTWQDNQGRIHYSNRLPSADQPVQEVDLNAAPVLVTPTQDIYIWKDEQGKVHYGDIPPEDQSSTTLNPEDVPLSTIRATAVRSGERSLLRELQKSP